MPADEARGVDFSSFLLLVNFGITAAIIASFFLKGPNDYVNIWGFYLSLAFSAQNFFFLFAVRRRPDPFVLLMVIHALFFYELRVATLLWSPFSIVFVRNLFSSADLNFAILFVMAANYAIFLGATLRSDHGLRPLHVSGKLSVRLGVPVMVFVFGALFSISSVATAVIRGYVSIIFNYEYVLLFALLLFALCYDFLARRQKILIVCMAVFFVIFRTAIGSRSAILTLFFYVVCVWSSVKGRFVLAKKTYLALVAAVPIALTLFLAASFVRAPIKGLQFQELLDRLGLLDMSAEVIASRIQYGGVINISHYFKSVVDSGLTPGFNLFDAPKAANALSAIYTAMPGISLQIVRENYNSDMMTVYGEAYSLLGPLAGLAGILIAAFLFQKAYRSCVFEDTFKTAVSRTVILVIFHTYFLGSFGIDWFIVDFIRSALPFIALFYLFSRYVRKVSMEV